jgi:hypothetical protein
MRLDVLSLLESESDLETMVRLGTHTVGQEQLLETYYWYEQRMQCRHHVFQTCVARLRDFTGKPIVPQ